MAKGFQVFVKGAKFLTAPSGYTPEEYYDDSFERVKTCSSRRAAERAMEKATGRKVYGLIAANAELVTYGSGVGVTVWEKKHWALERDAYILEVS